MRRVSPKSSMEQSRSWSAMELARLVLDLVASRRGASDVVAVELDLVAGRSILQPAVRGRPPGA